MKFLFERLFMALSMLRWDLVDRKIVIVHTIRYYFILFMCNYFVDYSDSLFLKIFGSTIYHIDTFIILAFNLCFLFLVLNRYLGLGLKFNEVFCVEFIDTVVYVYYGFPSGFYSNFIG